MSENTLFTPTFNSSLLRISFITDITRLKVLVALLFIEDCFDYLELFIFFSCNRVKL